MKTSTCPKCGFAAAQSFSDCPRCGIVVRKFQSISPKRNSGESRHAAPGRKSSLDKLARTEALVVRQEKEWGEILTGFENRNQYKVLDDSGNSVFHVEEESGSLGAILTRVMLTALRPFTLHITARDGQGILTLKRPFRFYFHELQICGANGVLLGSIQKRFSLLRRIYSVFDRNGREIYQLFGPLLHPWTFRINQGGRERGKITKKWSGLLQESFTDADSFGIRFPQGIDGIKKAVLLGAVFLIDFVHFENTGGNRSTVRIK